MNPLNLEGMPSVLLDPNLPAGPPQRPLLRKPLFRRIRTPLLCALIALFLSGCGSNPVKTSVRPKPPDTSLARIEVNDAGREIVMYALGLLDVGYVFGGKNPEAGLDCSGMVSFIYHNAIGLKLAGSAADMARKGRPVARDALQAGDLVFFNTMNKSFSHVGIYIGDDKFIHAPSSKGKIRIESIKTKYFATRYEAGRSYFAG